MCAEREKPQKQQWLEEAERAYEEFFARKSKSGKRLGTFRELEGWAVVAGDRLGRWLLERKISSESTEAEREKEHDCPYCGKPARPREEGPERREVYAKPGSVCFEREGFYCPSCRKVFFPSGPGTRPEV